MSTGLEVLISRQPPIPDGVFGDLTILKPGEHLLSLKTCEDDWKNNEPSISCIPAGTYTLHRTMYYHGGYEVFEVMNVPGRTRILIGH